MTRRRTVISGHTGAVLHLRVTCPATLTDDVRRVLTTTDGVVSVVVQRGVVVATVAGADVADLVEADGAAVTAVQQGAPAQGVDAVVWRQLVEHTRDDSTLSAAYLVFMLAAALIAAVGLLTDSQVLIVGAMVLGPEFSVLACLAVSAVDRDGRGAVAAARTLVVG